MLLDDYGDVVTCLDAHRGDCKGEVSYHPSLAGTGTPIPRCEHHYELRLEQDAEHRSIYPDSPNPPDWFDPMNAGEHWDDDY